MFSDVALQILVEVQAHQAIQHSLLQIRLALLHLLQNLLMPVKEGAYLPECLPDEPLLILLQLKLLVYNLRLLVKIMIPGGVVQDGPPQILNHSLIHIIHQINKVYSRVHALAQVHTRNIPLKKELSDPLPFMFDSF